MNRGIFNRVVARSVFSGRSASPQDQSYDAFPTSNYRLTAKISVLVLTRIWYVIVPIAFSKFEQFARSFTYLGFLFRVVRRGMEVISASN